MNNDLMNDDILRDFNMHVQRAKKTFLHTTLTLLAVGLGCGLISLAAVVCVILGCLRLFGVI